MKREVEHSDLEKLADALRNATKFLRARDEMNAVVHLAEHVRYSPLTSEVEAAYERCRGIIAP